MHAPYIDPGGFLIARRNATRTDAFPTPQQVGFPQAYARVIHNAHNYTNFGAQSRGLHPRYTRLRTPITGFARGFTTGLLAKL